MYFDVEKTLLRTDVTVKFILYRILVVFKQFSPNWSGTTVHQVKKKLNFDSRDSTVFAA